MSKIVTVRYNGNSPALKASLAEMLGVQPEASFAYPANPDKSLRPVTILEFPAKSDEEAKHFGELLAPVPGVEVVA